MAKSFTLTSAAYGGRYMKLECIQTPNVAGNYSDIAWTLTVTGGSSNYYSTGPTEVKIAGVQVYYCARKAHTTKTFPAAKGSVNGTVRVSHEDADGSCTVAVSLTTAIYYTASNTVSGSWTLDSIARASEISAADADIESAATVVVSRKNTAFTHSIAYAFGSLKGYLDSTGKPVAAEEKFTETTLNFLLPESFYAQIPNDPSGQCTLTCRTYSGTTLIGTKTCSFTAKAAQSRCAPLPEAAVEDVNPVSLALTGDKSKLIRFVSTARCYVAATARKSASITRITVDGVQVDGEYLDLPQAERNRYVVSCEDSRGYSGSLTISRDMIPYVMLAGNASIVRTDPTSGNARLTVTGSCYRGSFGAVENSLQVCCRVGGQEQLLEPQWKEDHSYRVEALLTDLDYTQTHLVEITVTDAVTSVTKTVTVKPGIPVFDWGQNDFAFHVPVQMDASVSGVYIRTASVSDGNRDITVQSRFSSFDGNTYPRQSLFLFGSDNGIPVFGVATLRSDGYAAWSGTEGVSIAAATDGQFVITLPIGAYDWFTLISAEPLRIV